MWTVRMYARCMNCDYGAEVEAVSATASSGNMGRFLAEHTQRHPEHRIQVMGSRPVCTLEEHRDATSTAVRCKCQAGVTCT